MNRVKVENWMGPAEC